MGGKEYKPFLNDAIHCPTEELAKEVLYLASKMGYKWNTGDLFIDCTHWKVNKYETCYYISGGLYGCKELALKQGYNVVSAEKFIKFYSRKNMEEKRNVQVTLEQAKEWFKSENKTLKTLALSAFSEAELEDINFEDIFNEESTMCPTFYHVPEYENKKWSVIHKLAILAQHFNSKRVKPDIQYFIKGKYEGEIQIGKHISVQYPGIIYFNDPDDLLKTIRIIGKDIKYLF